MIVVSYFFFPLLLLFFTLLHYFYSSFSRSMPHLTYHLPVLTWLLLLVASSVERRRSGS
ncbi:hypothetical protein K435DRAFT_312399 [Dendrothele bispora CBS 962.96]|uniref:Uncharacterized protein n=1 Tax=Dendrothele bispora (strain CBS 962.96) TaxID=1314807 RepID=A0A4S8LHL0_DENBC|nr:hypothetical protein K435DRAFT_312399 [Dendrothele bispora CBS 962.96]